MGRDRHRTGEKEGERELQDGNRQEARGKGVKDVMGDGS
jgi:hypothetical protein